MCKGKARALKKLLFCLVMLVTSLRSYATHIFGVDLYYTHVAGNTYTIHLVVYGDCSGAAFSTLSSAVPVINIYNGSSFISSLSLAIQAPANGVEVTPVCAADVGLTTCTSTSYTIPGVKKFVYTANTTLTGTSTDWRFLFQGVMGSSSAGRSNTITNILGGTIIQLVDTLNNVPAPPHSNAIFSAIPTPFFCDNVSATYNPGAVPTAGDSIALFLVPGVDASTGVNVNYITPYTATSPLAVAAGSFSFTSTTGQLSFMPNLLQRALVVYNVEEYNGGVLRGTCQREMTFVVLTCTSTPPAGGISSLSSGTLVSPTDVNICGNTGPYSFDIDPTDAGGYNITMTASGLPAGANFNIVGNGTTAPLGTFTWTTTGVAPGSYIFYITYQDNGCPLAGTQTIAYTIDVLAVPSETVTTVSAATCTKKAVFHVAPGGSASPWTVEALQSGTVIQTISGVTGTITDSLAAGTYTLRTLNGNGCYADTTITFMAPALPVPHVVVAPPLCPNGNTGMAVVSATGGAPPYQYAIGSGSYAATDTFRNLSPGQDTIRIVDTNGCVKDTAVTIPNATPMLMNIYIRKPLCDTFRNGRVIISAYNSTGPYTYAIGSGGTFSGSDTFNNLGAGTDTFMVKNANGCIVDTVLTLQDSVILHGAVTIAPVLCNAGRGTVTVTASGGSALPYMYSYNTSPFSTTNVFSLTAGGYTINVHDANLCYWDTTVTLTQPSPINISTVLTNVLCHGAATGAIAVTATGGTPAYQYNADGSAYSSSSTLSGLAAGTHIVNVQDANGCVYSDTVVITQPPVIAVDSVVSAMPLCNGASNGSLTIYVSGGTAPYLYTINTGIYGASNRFTGLAASTDTLRIKDANGCTADTGVVLAQPPPINISATVKPSLCSTLANGQVVIAASGGTPAYLYTIGSGTYVAGNTFAPLAAGIDTFAIEDANGCVKDTIITVPDSLHIHSIVSVTPALCHNQASGVISITGTGGSSPYAYAIGTGSYGASSVFTGLSAGTYQLYVKDNNGCIDDTLLTVTQPARITAALTITEPLCYGGSTGSVTITAAGGTPSYTYAWNNGTASSSPTFSGIRAGVDSITIKDANGCVFDTVFTMLQPARLSSTLSITNVLCFDSSNGAVVVTGVGGTSPFTYSVDSSAWQSSGSFSGFVARRIYVQVKDNNGCQFDTSANLSQPMQLIIARIDTTDPTCVGYSNGSVLMAASGGTPPYVYTGAGISGASGLFGTLAAGTYTFVVNDANGCNTDTAITLTGFPAIVIDSVSVTGPSCYGGTNGSMDIVASGGVPPLAYSSNNSLAQHSGGFNNLRAGSYTIAITDSKNCVKDTTLQIDQPDSITLTATVVPNECQGEASVGSISVTPDGGTLPYKYLWSTTPAQTSPVLSGLANGYYTVTVTDSNNCSSSLTAEIVYNNCCIPFVPNAFTPNNDGLNDFFKLYFKGDIYIVVFEIYNRFGQRVYSISNTNNPEPGWDGKFEGVNCDLGTYFYYAKIICGNKGNRTEELKGDVTLVR